MIKLLDTKGNIVDATQRTAEIVKNNLGDDEYRKLQEEIRLKEEELARRKKAQREEEEREKLEKMTKAQDEYQKIIQQHQDEGRWIKTQKGYFMLSEKGWNEIPKAVRPGEDYEEYQTLIPYFMSAQTKPGRSLSEI